MNQTKKRLSIINLAISITDIETIQLQTLQLGPLRTDKKILEILNLLKAENYIQAQRLITSYIDTPTNDIVQRTFQKEIVADDSIMDDFTLPVKPEKNAKLRTLNFNDMLELANRDLDDPPKKTEKSIDINSILDIDGDSVLPNNIKLDNGSSSKNKFWKKKKLNIHTSDVPRDTFFDTEESVAEKIEDDYTKELLDDSLLDIKKNNQEDISTTVNKQEADTDKTINNNSVNEVDEEAKLIKFKKIPYIDQKFKNMQLQYPPVQETLEIFPSVKAWLEKISLEGYTEEDIEIAIEKIDSLSIEDNEEAAQLILVTASTESTYANFRLARILYKGDVLQQNIPESFRIINSLAINDDYPEAICDLAQFYEHGIGANKDKKEAERLYKEAMELGIKRAESNYERIEKENRGFFSFLKK